MNTVTNTVGSSYRLPVMNLTSRMTLANGWTRKRTNRGKTRFTFYSGLIKVYSLEEKSCQQASSSVHCLFEELFQCRDRQITHLPVVKHLQVEKRAQVGYKDK